MQASSANRTTWLRVTALAASILALAVLAAACAAPAGPLVPTATQPGEAATTLPSATSGPSPVATGSTPATVPATTEAIGTPAAATPPPDARKLGGEPGNRAPTFTVTLLDGTTTDLQAQLDIGKPLLLYFFATWWPHCRAEFRTLKALYPSYQDKVTVLGISFDASESPDALQRYAQSEGIPWRIAVAQRQMAADYNVLVQSTKLGIDTTGTVVFRKGYGTNSDDFWRQTLDELTSP